MKSGGIAGSPCMAMALAASATFGGAQARAIVSAHNTVCRRSPATPFRGCLGEKEFETIRFTEGECIMTGGKRCCLWCVQRALKGRANWNLNRFQLFPDLYSRTCIPRLALAIWPLISSAN